jgi:hypothetical protein
VKGKIIYLALNTPTNISITRLYFPGGGSPHHAAKWSPMSIKKQVFQILSDGTTPAKVMVVIPMKVK